MKQIRPILMMLCGLWLLIGCSADKGQMLQQLELLEQMNRADSVMRNDSLAEDLVAYFDKHGTPNERMRARYILGRTYFDLGELPRSLETYLDAAGCADTTAADCDYKTLSRIHAQSAEIFFSQLQPQSALSELRKAVHSARIANDTLQAIECYSQQADAYKMLHCHDSVISIKEGASKMYLEINRPERSAKKLGGAISSLLHNNDLERAKRYIQIYESNSGLFDESGNIVSGREIYYHIKGEYYLATGRIDSAEYMFRKELRYGKDLNNQIAGSKGLQKVYVRMGIVDSIAKYASVGYELNDSAYSLSEMQNIQRLQASYNYNHKLMYAEQESNRANRIMLILVIFAILVIIGILLSFYFITEYKKKKNQSILQYRQNLEQLEKTQTELMQLRSQEKQEAEELVKTKDEELRRLQEQICRQQQQMNRQLAELENKIDNSVIVKHLHELLEQNPPEEATPTDFRDLRLFMNEVIPSFYQRLNTTKCSLRTIEYNICLLVRFHFRPAEISRLTGLKDNHIANIRKGILLKVFNIVGSPKDLDEILLQIKE